MASVTDSPGRSGPDRGPASTLVTGGAGFVGSHLVDVLLAAGRRVTVVDNFSTGRRSNLAGHPGPVRLIEADLTAALSAFGGGERFDEVYHLAAAVGVKRIVERPIESIENNVAETAAVMRFALDHGPAPGVPARVLFTSSSEVYGKSEKLPFSEDDDSVLGPTTAPRWSYAAAKAIGEHLALAHHRAHGLPVVVARLFNTVGPRQVGEYGMVLPRFVRAALAGEDLTVFGDGEQTRCFCDVRDVAPALVRLLAEPAAHGRVVNVGGDAPVSIDGLARLVVRTLGSASAVRTVPYVEAYGSGFEDLRDRRPDLTRVRGLIGFAPAIGLERTIRDIAAFVSLPAEGDGPADSGGG